MSQVLRVKWVETDDESTLIAGAMTAWNRKAWPKADAKSSTVYSSGPDLKKQAKARAALAKLTKGATKVVEADGTEVFTWA